jgi:hypothetical protein
MDSSAARGAANIRLDLITRAARARAGRQRGAAWSKQRALGCVREARSCTITIDARSVSLATSAAAAAACDEPFTKRRAWKEQVSRCEGEVSSALDATAH